LREEESLPGGEGLLAVGKILRPHGIRGALVVEALTDWPSRFDPGGTLLLEAGPGRFEEVKIVTGAPHKGRFLVALEGVEDREAAEGLRGRYLMIDRCDASPLADGEYWVHDLTGMKVVDASGALLGEVDDVLCRPAQDLLLVKAEGGGEFSVPFVKEFVKDVDTEAGKVTVELMEGMAP
jgi:16S rRNA processing protein RimM